MSTLTETKNTGKIQGLPRMVVMALLIAIIFIMAFTPVGYLRIGPAAISFLSLPVAIGAIMLGPAAGAVLGFAFGITSFIQCFMGDPLGAALISINPYFTVVLCVVSRTLMGWLAGLIFVGLNRVDKTKSRIISYAGGSLSAPVLNTVLFVGSLILLFWNTDYLHSELAQGKGILFLLGTMVLNAVVEAITVCVLGTAISKALATAMKRFVH